MIKSISIVVSGEVQGVFFRQSTKEIADIFSINGFVCNRKDGSVYIEAEGSKDNLEKFLKWCKKGPKLAKVTNLKISEQQIKNYTTFEIKR